MEPEWTGFEPKSSPVQSKQITVTENKEKAAEVVGIEPMPEEGIRKSLLALWQSLKSLRCW